MNNKRNSKLAVLAVAVAASAIGAGAVVSGNAMAGSDPADTATDSVSVVSLGVDGEGEAIECSFDGADLPGVFGSSAAVAEASVGEIAVGELAEGAVIDGEAIQVFPESGDSVGGQSFSVSVSGEVTEGEVLPTELGELMEEGSASAGSVSADAEAIPVGELPEGMQVINAGDARQGTPEECAEILKGMTVTP